jgi:hypothetical protein
MMAEQANESSVADRRKSGHGGIDGAVGGLCRRDGPASIFGAIAASLFQRNRWFQ